MKFLKDFIFVNFFQYFQIISEQYTLLRSRRSCKLRFLSQDTSSTIDIYHFLSVCILSTYEFAISFLLSFKFFFLLYFFRFHFSFCFPNITINIFGTIIDIKYRLAIFQRNIIKSDNWR